MREPSLSQGTTCIVVGRLWFQLPRSVGREVEVIDAEPVVIEVPDRGPPNATRVRPEKFRQVRLADGRTGYHPERMLMPIASSFGAGTDSLLDVVVGRVSA